MIRDRSNIMLEQVELVYNRISTDQNGRWEGLYISAIGEAGVTFE